MKVFRLKRLRLHDVVDTAFDHKSEVMLTYIRLPQYGGWDSA
jgi:hypothetical protein